MKKKVVSIFFNPLAYFPPSINALAILSKKYDVISFSIGENDNKLDIPKCIQVNTVVKNKESKGKVATMKHFFSFVKEVLSSLRRERPNVVLMYDDYGLFAYYLIRNLVPKPDVLWFHSHDISEGNPSKTSLEYWALRAQRKLFKKLNVFSIPSIERKSYFRMNDFKGSFIHIPNYPSIWLYSKHKRQHAFNKENIKIIYQGRVSAGHGLKEIIKHLEHNKQYELTIIGFHLESFVQELNNLVDELNLSSRVHILNPVSYDKLVPITSTHDIGIGINESKRIQYQTGGAASNKLYEYAALGMPTLYTDSPHYNEYLSKYSWAFPTKLEKKSIGNNLTIISDNYKEISSAALEDFKTQLNFEKEFEKVLKVINELL